MYDININSFCENLKLFRKSRQITLEMLGEKINKTKATVSKYEKGEIIPDFITVLEICNSLNISVSQLFPASQNELNKTLNRNPFSSNIIYMYYYTEKRLITSIIEIYEENNIMKVKYYNGVKDIIKYAENVSYEYEGILECDKTIGYINLRNINFQNTQLEKLQISFNISWSNDFEITNCFIIGLTPNSLPVVKKGILSINPIKNFEKFEEDLKITQEEMNKILYDNGWILYNKNFNHFFFDK